jgi:IPT/TIG domain
MKKHIFLRTLMMGAVLGAAISAFAQNPTISGFSPSSGPVGTTVVINGANFDPPLSIVFAGNASASGSFTSTKITVTVPSGAETGPITVNTANGSVSTSTSFVVGGASSGNPAIVMNQPVRMNAQVQLGFTVSNLTNPTFHLLQTPQLNDASWTTNTTATLITITPNSAYQFTATASSNSQFYRVQTP